MMRLMDAPLSQAAMLVIGCGYLYPEVVLWSSNAHFVVGVDVRSAFWKNGVSALHREWRARGESFLAASARALYERRKNHRYYQHLRGFSGNLIDATRQNLVAYDGMRLPFADGTFDIVYSNAVLEHVMDLRSLAMEMSRVTSRGGINYHLWHNYSSLSGGHIDDSIAVAHPWGHLLHNPDIETIMRKSRTCLNKMHPGQIVEVLSDHLDTVSVFQLDRHHNKKGVDREFEYEGLSLLTKDLEEYLSGYSRESLLTRAYLYIGRKSQSSQDHPETAIPLDGISISNEQPSPLHMPAIQADDADTLTHRRVLSSCRRMDSDCHGR